MSKTPVKYVHLTEKSLQIIEGVEGKTFSAKLEQLIRGYDCARCWKEKELECLDMQIKRRQESLAAMKAATEAAEQILRKHMIW